LSKLIDLSQLRSDEELVTVLENYLVVVKDMKTNEVHAHHKIEHVSEVMDLEVFQDLDPARKQLVS